ncbi:hypothetical protein A8U91_00291 [Halomonas elongata]|uniref:Uncharacterized protein n=1 Tax=Halomonas elongata TaxID=2746 RepID=A0A1B8P116_HALEL|nr:hypothetical protein A8U91_00291 [Halomonas elongata]
MTDNFSIRLGNLRQDQRISSAKRLYNELFGMISMRSTPKS